MDPPKKELSTTTRTLYNDPYIGVVYNESHYHSLPRSSRVAVGVSTLVLNVLPYDVATYPSGEVPDHFIPYDLVLEEVAEYLAPC